jgi:hypothetical protein
MLMAEADRILASSGWPSVGAGRDASQFKASAARYDDAW